MLSSFVGRNNLNNHFIDIQLSFNFQYIYSEEHQLNYYNANKKTSFLAGRLNLIVLAR